MTRGRIPIITNYKATDLIHIKANPYGGDPWSVATPVSNFFKRGNVLQGLPYNVVHYGATGDGATDDAAAIQAAIAAATAAGGGVVFVPTGEYLIGTTLDLYDNIHLQGAGWNSVITVASNRVVVRAETVDDVIVSNLKIIGDADGAKVNQTAIQFNEVTNGLVSAVFLQDMGYDGIQFLRDNSGCRAIGCHVDNCQDDGINIGGWAANPVVDSVVIGNYVSGCVSDGIHISDSSSHTTVSGNTIEGCALGVGLFKADFATVCDNVIRDCTDASMGVIFVSSDIIVANNVCDGGVHGIHIKNISERWVIQGNTITNCSENGIYLESGNHINIHSNAITDCTKNGIYCGTGTDISIAGNYFEGVVEKNIAVYSGDHYLIANNKMIGADRGISVTIAAVTITISGNHIKESVVSGIVMSVAGPSAAEAIISNNLIIDGCTATGMTIYGFTNVLIDGNYIVGIAGAEAIKESGTSANNTIINNKIGTGTIDPDATSVVRGNIGFVTENGGTSAAIATGATIAHGCALTPTIVHVNAAEAGPTDITISVDATDITVNFGGGGNKTFFWCARVYP